MITFLIALMIVFFDQTTFMTKVFLAPLIGVLGFTVLSLLYLERERSIAEDIGECCASIDNAARELWVKLKEGCVRPRSPITIWKKFRSWQLESAGKHGSATDPNIEMRASPPAP